MPSAATVREAKNPEDLASVRALLREYASHLNDSVGGEHICLDNYEKELEALPGVYAAPSGVLLLACVADEAAGCVALKPLQPLRAAAQHEAACEMKRLWVRPRFRGQALGLRLATALIERAISLGYTAMYLDTMPATMQAASRMYQSLGFEAVERYYSGNPVLRPRPGCEAAASPEVVFFRRSLA